MIISFTTATTIDVNAGPLIDYMDCTQSCLDTYGNWTWRGSACLADCYLALIGTPLEMIVDKL